MTTVLRSIVKYVFALAFYYSGIGGLLLYIKKRRRRPWPLVLMYHRIVEPKDAAGLQPGMFVYKDIFEKQIEYISRCFRILSIGDFTRGLAENRRYGGDEMIVTIDDGWRDNFTNGLPIFKKYNIGATIYLTANFIGTDYLLWFQEISSILSRPDINTEMLAEAIKGILRKYPDSTNARELLNNNIVSLLTERDRFIEILKKLDAAVTLEITGEFRKLTRKYPIKNDEERQLLNWDEVRAMAQNGIEFGSHGLSHRLLDSLDTEEAYKELIESKAIIEERLGRPISSFTYPNGNYNRDIEVLVEKAGYDCAFIVGKNRANQEKRDRFAIDRAGVHNGVSVSPFGKYSKAMFAWHLYRNL
jgi:peptidoglycan/xylan/chitin deacetylase (PgdA/CDA1 family)